MCECDSNRIKSIRRINFRWKMWSPLFTELQKWPKWFSATKIQFLDLIMFIFFLFLKFVISLDFFWIYYYLTKNANRLVFYIVFRAPIKCISFAALSLVSVSGYFFFIYFATIFELQWQCCKFFFFRCGFDSQILFFFYHIRTI